jgi:aspartate-semialdehyde dehydrogenase
MKVAVVGATGLVGTKMLQVLAERNFPVTELVPVASERSVGKEVEFKGKKYKVVSMQDGIDAKPAVAIFLPVAALHSNGRRNLQRLALQSLTILLPGGWTPLKNWWYRK